MNRVVPECQITAKSTKRGINANIDLTKKLLKQVDMYGSLLEAKRRQSLTKPDKIRFLNETKQTELAKQKHGVNKMHTNICVTSDMSFATPQSTVLLYFL